MRILPKRLPGIKSILGLLPRRVLGIKNPFRKEEFGPKFSAFADNARRNGVDLGNRIKAYKTMGLPRKKALEIELEFLAFHLPDYQPKARKALAERNINTVYSRKQRRK